MRGDVILYITAIILIDMQLVAKLAVAGLVNYVQCISLSEISYVEHVLIIVKIKVES